MNDGDSIEVTFVAPTGERFPITVPVGSNLKDAALHGDVPGIIGECGGYLSCGTCHVYVPEGWRERIAPPAPEEEEMLAIVLERQAGSRLSCQIIASQSLDGMIIELPESQT